MAFRRFPYQGQPCPEHRHLTRLSQTSSSDLEAALTAKIDQLNAMSGETSFSALPPFIITPSSPQRVKEIIKEAANKKIDCRSYLVSAAIHTPPTDSNLTAREMDSEGCFF
jgi:hypothetical protein